MFSALKLFSNLGNLFEVELSGAVVALTPYTTEGGTYTAEDGVTVYMAEDGITEYTPEAGGAVNYTAEDGVTIYTVES